MQHLFSQDVSGQFSVFFKDIYGLITVRQETRRVRQSGERLLQRRLRAARAASRRASSRASATSSRPRSTTRTRSRPAWPRIPNAALAVLQRRPPLPADRGAAARLGPAPHAQRAGRSCAIRASGASACCGRTARASRSRRRSATTATRSRARQLAPPAVGRRGSRSTATSSTGLGTERDVVLRRAQRPRTRRTSRRCRRTQWLPESVHQPGRATTTRSTTRETGRAGGAYLQDTNGDNVLDWVPVNDPRVFEEGRNVRLGVSVTF